MNQSNLRDQLVKYFDESELNNICFDLNIDYQNLPGETKQDQARELITYCQRHGLMEKFITRCRELRPHVSWEYDDSQIQKEPKEQERKRNISTWMIIGIVGTIIIFGGFMISYLIKDTRLSPPSTTSDNFEETQSTTFPTTSTTTSLPSSVAQANSLDITREPESSTIGPLPVQLPDGQKVTLHPPGREKIQYEILSAQLEPLNPGSYLLHLRIRAWTDKPSINFWNDSFRLHVGDISQAPVNELNEVVYRDETVDGDIEFEIDDSLTEAVLVISGFGETEELHLLFPTSPDSINSPEVTKTPASSTSDSLSVQLPDGQKVTLHTAGGDIVQYEILSAQLEPLNPGSYLLHLHIRAWTELPNMNFWSDSFRLHIGSLKLAPVNDLNEVVKRDETVDGDIEFEIEDSFTGAVLVISEYDDSKELRLIFP